MSRRAKVNRAKFPLVYVGPDTRYGLRNSTALRHMGKARAGLHAYDASDGRKWQVPPSQVAPYVRPDKLAERVRGVIRGQR